MDQSTHEVRLASWKDIILQCHNRPAGMTARAWLAENGINEKQYYYYQRTIRSEVFEEMKAGTQDRQDSSSAAGQLPAVRERGAVTFAEIPQETVDSVIREISSPAASVQSIRQPDAVVHTSCGTIELSNSISDSLLRSILEVMCHA